MIKKLALLIQLIIKLVNVFTLSIPFIALNVATKLLIVLLGLKLNNSIKTVLMLFVMKLLVPAMLFQTKIPLVAILLVPLEIVQQINAFGILIVLKMVSVQFVTTVLVFLTHAQQHLIVLLKLSMESVVLVSKILQLLQAFVIAMLQILLPRNALIVMTRTFAQETFCYQNILSVSTYLNVMTIMLVPRIFAFHLQMEKLTLALTPQSLVLRIVHLLKSLLIKFLQMQLNFGLENVIKTWDVSLAAPLVNVMIKTDVPKILALINNVKIN